MLQAAEPAVAWLDPASKQSACIMCGQASAADAQAVVQHMSCMEGTNPTDNQEDAICGVCSDLLTLCAGSWRLLHRLLLNAAAECI
jgi:hypothetical protein